MPLTREQLEAKRQRLFRVLTALHPGWAQHVEFAARYGLEKKVLAGAPQPLPESVTPDTITDLQRAALQTRMKAALADPADRALVDEMLGP